MRCASPGLDWLLEDESNERRQSSKRSPSLRERIDFLLVDGRRSTPAELARLLRVSSTVRKRVVRMAADRELATRGDGWYCATEAARRQLNAQRAAARGSASHPDCGAASRAACASVELRPSTITMRSAGCAAQLEAWLTSPKGSSSSMQRRSCSIGSVTSPRTVRASGTVKNVTELRWGRQAPEPARWVSAAAAAPTCAGRASLAPSR